MTNYSQIAFEARARVATLLGLPLDYDARARSARERVSALLSR